MDVTQEEKERGIQFISDMTLDDFMKVINAKLSELNDKAEKYMKECEADIRKWKNLTPHQVNVLIDIHKSYIESARAALEDLKDICTKNLHKDYLVPSLIVETFIDLSRKVATIAYIKLPESHIRLAS
jgi:predicted nuclease with TOPRIM domain